MSGDHPVLGLERALRVSCVATIAGLGLVVPAALTDGAGALLTPAMVILSLAAAASTRAYYKLLALRSVRASDPRSTDDS